MSDSSDAATKGKNGDTKNNDLTDSEPETKAREKKELKLAMAKIKTPDNDGSGSDPTEVFKELKKPREKRRKSLRDVRKSRPSLEDEGDPEALKDGKIDATATKSKFLRKPFKKPAEKSESQSTASKDTREDDELKNLIHSYATDDDSGSDEDLNKDDPSKFEPRKFDAHIVISDSSDEQLSDVADEDLNKDSGRTSAISYTSGEPTPHSHLDKLVDKAIGGGLFSTFPSEVTFHRGHRLSVYDAVEAHLLRHGKRTFLFRTVIVAKHEESSRELIAWHSKTIEAINSVCYDELATGFFLIYPRYFVHVVEGSEETVSKFITEHSKEFDRDKDEIENATGPNKRHFTTVTSVIIGFFSIQERFLERWVYEKTKPYNRYVHKGAFRKRLFEFLKSTFIMCTAVGRLPENHPLLTVKVDKPPEEVETEEDRIKGKEVLAVEYVQRMREIAQWMPSKKTLIDILTKKPSRKIQLKTPKEFIKKYWDLPPIILTSETDWPIPCRIAPYD